MTLMEKSEDELNSLLTKVKTRVKKLAWNSTLKKKPLRSWNYWSHHFMANRKGKQWQILYFLGLQNHCGWLLQSEIKRHLFFQRKAKTNLDSLLKIRHIILLTKVWHSQSYSFSSSHAQMWELDHEEGWAPKNWCFWIVVLGKTLKSPLDNKEIKPVNLKGNQPWIFIGRTVAEAEASILWPPGVKSQLIRKGPDAGKDWRQKEKWVAEDEMAR